MQPTGSNANRHRILSQSALSHSVPPASLLKTCSQTNQQIPDQRATVQNIPNYVQSHDKLEGSAASQINVTIHSASPMPDELIESESSAEQSVKTVSTGVIIREILQVVVPALLLALVIHLFLAQATVVYGRSMEPNLSESQRLIIDKLTYRFRTPQRNEIVVLNIPTMDEMLVKRIVGLPGERVAIRNGIVYINGAELEESFQHNLSDYDMPEMTLGPLSYFVLGDNRTNSNDSRVFGSVKRETIVGRVWLRYWPLPEFRLF